jgi:hypothetical protein
MSPKKVIGWFVRGLIAVYGLHIIVVVFWEFIPMERREVQGIRYEIRRGFGFPIALIPLVGVSPVVGDEPVRLITTDLATGHREEKGYDVAYDIHQAHPEVWPESRR